MEDFNVYKDIQDRTNGEIYIGVVGPVRTGKSTFIKKFMDTVVSSYLLQIMMGRDSGTVSSKSSFCALTSLSRAR